MIDIPDINSISRIADWIELQLILSKKSLSKSKITTLLKNSGEDPSEEIIDSIISELRRREYLYPSNYHFILNGNIVEPLIHWKEIPELMMCLIFSIRGVVKKRNKKDGTKLFEILSKYAIEGYLNGEAEVVGFPNKSKLSQQIKEISRKMNEMQGTRIPRPKDKDKGVDIIAWKTHGDSRCNQIVLLLQCGAGIHYGLKKPISLTAWKEFINWSACPSIGIIIPTILKEDEWTEVRDDYNLIFDRVRIIHAFKKNNPIEEELKNKIIQWCEEQLN